MDSFEKGEAGKSDRERSSQRSDNQKRLSGEGESGDDVDDDDGGGDGDDVQRTCGL